MIYALVLITLLVIVATFSKDIKGGMLLQRAKNIAESMSSIAYGLVKIRRNK